MKNRLRLFLVLFFIFNTIFFHGNAENEIIFSIEELQGRGVIKHDDFVLNAIPKCGTHLIMNCIYYMINKRVDEGYDYINEVDYTPDRAWHYVRFLVSLKGKSFIHKTHVPYFPEMEKALLQARMKSLFFVRDPRDAIVSLVFYMEKMSGDRRDFMEINSSVYDILSLDEKIEALMTGSSCTNYLDKYWKSLIGWSDSSCCQVARFEDIIGPCGGGTLEKQLEAINQICSYLNISLSYGEKMGIAFYTNSYATPSIQNALGLKYTQGQIGNWMLFFSESNKDLFKKLFGKELIKLGYEQDNNW